MSRVVDRLANLIIYCTSGLQCYPWLWIRRDIFDSSRLSVVCGCDIRSNVSSVKRSVSSPDETLRKELKNTTTRSGVVLTNFEVPHLVIKHCGDETLCRMLDITS